MAELVAPAWSTSRETLPLSDIDDDNTLRYYESRIEFFRPRSMDDRRVKTATAIRAALSKALVYYYPLAGRLRRVPGGKLEVECTGEGVVFVEANADIRLQDFRVPLVQPYPCVEELLCDIGDASLVVDKPLFFMQVTQLQCGSFVIGFHMVQSIADAYGMYQFMNAITDLARGEAVPTVWPVWERELLMARNPPRITHINHAYETLLKNSRTQTTINTMPPNTWVDHCFVFSPTDVASLRKHLPMHLDKSASVFELLTCVIWRCRTVAMGYEPIEHVYLAFTVNGRGRWRRIPPGYYGNAIFSPIVQVTVDELSSNPIGHTLELMRQADIELTEEHMMSMVDMAALMQGRPPLLPHKVYSVCDFSRVGNDRLDFGWAERVGGGIATPTRRLTSYHVRCKNVEGDESIAVTMFLPRPAMQRFATELLSWLSNNVLPSSL